MSIFLKIRGILNGFIYKEEYSGTMKAIILGSNRGIRDLDGTESYPLALLEDKRGQRALDWTLLALSQISVNDVIFVGGYHIEKVVRLYPKLRFYFNPEWQEESDLQALTKASSELKGPCIIIRSDIVFRPDVLRSLMAANADVVVGVQAGTPASKELTGEKFAGLVVLSGAAATRLKKQVESGSQNTAAEKELELIQILAGLGLSTLFIDIGASWARIDTPRSLSRFIFGTKAQTLERLRPLVTQATILDQIRFTIRDWRNDFNGILDRICTTFPTGLLVVRSSALSEDSWAESQAGKFRSKLEIDTGNRHGICEAIESVIESFSENGNTHDLNEVFVQPYLKDVALSGVLFTREPEGAPYLVVNYDDITQRTDTVTSGQGKNLRTFNVYKYSLPSVVDNPYIAHLINVVSELEELLGYGALDIEFAFDTSEKCYIFQVRVLVGHDENFSVTDTDIEEELVELREYVNELMKPSIHLDGDTTILANMPDWNPAEIIGVSPRPLALSLYQYLITNRIWGQARAASGYRDTYPEPLIVSLAGHPYVDTRASFNSFLPATITPALGHKLVNHYLTWLREHREFHDKIEFEVALTCLDFDFNRHQQRLLENGFTQKETEEIRKSLFTLTDNIVSGRIATIENQVKLVEQLTKRREKVLSSEQTSLVSIIRTVDFLLDDCIKFGTLPFSILARYAFIATSFLKSLRVKGVLSPKDIDRVTSLMPSVASEISYDLYMLSNGSLTREGFLKKYGHLRPGTYDITSPSYSEAPELYLGNLDSVAEVHGQNFILKDSTVIFKDKLSEISDLIREAGFTFSVSRLQDFICASIPAREKAKF